ncbi:MAG TPA: nicotinamide-nucleotide amidohydrolase family protein [Deltaproteobacteria bacterium]|jgi:nicotinamide-nucleotide amidase|nr:nicotinamide-nucleotide amidohydrolase family protein [Deltaproteobacteria bacterium]HOI08008.1 nicotinamide-nucleotide amidohydrolase family protein [Deltaproteobacteria bacterium]
MKGSIIITGSEILCGLRQDLLIQPLAAMMVSRGIAMGEIRVIGDDPAVLLRTILDVQAESDLIVVTGGLGLTPDDTTPAAVRMLEEKEHISRNPDIANPVGSALGIDLSFESGTRVMFFPGVPAETLAMFATVVDRLNRGAPQSVEVAVFGLREVEIARRLGDLAPSCGYLPRDMEVAVIVPSALEERVRRILGRHALEGRDLNATVGALLRGRGLTCATAESCTGGLIAHLMTQLPGSSDYFLGSVVSYSNDIKTRVLGVSEELIIRHGAVSREVALAMLEGVLALTGADVGLATTGIAGPSGGTAAKPVGTVWIAAGGRAGHMVRDYRFSFDRAGNKMIFAKTALFQLRSCIHDSDIHRI